MIKSTTAKPAVSPQWFLEELANHPDHGNWKAAILIRSRATARWPKWTLEHALATVDRNNAVHSVQFFIRPPLSWDENEAADLPGGVTLEKIAGEGLEATRAIPLLNRIFGSQRVYSTGSMHVDDREIVERAGGERLTWRPTTSWCWLGDELTVDISEESSVRFVCRIPIREALIERAHLAAQSFVKASIIHQTVAELAGAENRELGRFAPHNRTMASKPPPTARNGAQRRIGKFMEDVPEG